MPPKLNDGPSAYAESVAAATGHTADTVRARGARWCRMNPVTPREDFDLDQSLPDFDEAIRTAADEDVAADYERRQRRTPDGFTDKEHDSQIVPAGRDYRGVAFHLQSQGTTFARVSAGEVRSISLRRIAAEGGVVHSLWVDGQEHLRTPVMTDEDANVLEPAHRAALHSFAESLPLVGRAGRTTAMIDPRLSRASNDAPAQAIADRLARTDGSDRRG